MLARDSAQHVSANSSDPSTPKSIDQLVASVQAEFGVALNDPTKIQDVWNEMGNAPSLQQQAGNDLRNLLLAAKRAVEDSSFDFIADVGDLLGYSRDFNDSYSQALLMSRSTVSIPISQILAGINFNSVSETAETTTPMEVARPSIYILPNYKTVIKPLIDGFKSLKNPREKFEYWAHSEVLIALFEANPTVSSTTPDYTTYRNWVGQTLRNFMGCYTTCCGSDVDVMILLKDYKSYWDVQGVVLGLRFLCNFRKSSSWN